MRKAALISENVTLTRKTNNIVTLFISVIAFTQPRLTELSRGPHAALSSSARRTVCVRSKQSLCSHLESPPVVLLFLCSDFILCVCFCFFYCECRVMTCISCQCRGLGLSWQDADARAAYRRTLTPTPSSASERDSDHPVCHNNY